MLRGHLNIPAHSLSALESIFVWIILRKTKSASHTVISNHASCNAVKFELDKFWQFGEISNTKFYTQEELAYEKHLIQAFSGYTRGRFDDKFPPCESNDDLRSSRNIAYIKLNSFSLRINSSPLHTTNLWRII
ncbi:uncharacterized protein LOC103569155 [Caerostris darwini]|uniref:Uncharacterized protein LOC103569155, partial n=1 Tax=Caerostris darwini TaxID=1538125 RepID=A0AAV4VK22_9ARAC|nr:uncharacterized protein LOC103569155 [Caerostris darwini]